MNTVKAIRRTARIAVNALAVIVGSLLVAGSAQFCLCDDDPDDCGHECHDCSEPADQDDCNHVTVEIDEYIVPQNDNILAATAIEAPVRDFFVHQDFKTETLPCPSAASPPLWRGRYVSYSLRLNPLS